METYRFLEMTIPGNLKLTGYGVELTRLSEDKIELVRKWRNDEQITRYMEYREYITKEQQESWFHRINNDNNLYLIISVEGHDIGLINIKNIDYNIGVGESGIFIWDDNFYDKKISYKSRLLMLDYAFIKLRLQKIISHVLYNNIRSQKSILSMGYVLGKGQESIKLQEYYLSSKRYFSYKTNTLAKIGIL